MVIFINNWIKCEDELIVDDKNNVKWKLNEGKIFSFSYNGILGKLELVNKIRNSDYVLVRYNNVEYKTIGNGLLKCKLKNIVTNISNNFKYKIGDSIQSKKGSKFLIIDRYSDVNNKNRSYKIKCNICGYEFINKENNNFGCGCCSGKVIVQGINSAYDTFKSLIGIVSDSELKSTTRASNAKVLTKCPNCGYEEVKVMNYLSAHSYNCKVCGDGISYVEKVVHAFLIANNITYTPQISSKKLNVDGNYRYDFLIEYLNDKFIILESNGAQHKNRDVKNWKSSKEQIKIDEHKKYLALFNKDIIDYISVDCSVSNHNFIIEKLIQSNLRYYFDLNVTNIDIESIIINNIRAEACRLYMSSNKNVSKLECAKSLGISEGTYSRYLLEGKTLFNWFKLTAKERKYNSREVCVFSKDGILIKEVSSISELSKSSLGLLGKHMPSEKLSQILRYVINPDILTDVRISYKDNSYNSNTSKIKYKNIQVYRHDILIGNFKSIGDILEYIYKNYEFISYSTILRCINSSKSYKEYSFKIEYS